eukprot:342421-Rhodomonas_salina.1
MKTLRICRGFPRLGTDMLLLLSLLLLAAHVGNSTGGRDTGRGPACQRGGREGGGGGGGGGGEGAKEEEQRRRRSGRGGGGSCSVAQHGRYCYYHQHHGDDHAHDHHADHDGCCAMPVIPNDDDVDDHHHDHGVVLYQLTRSLDSLREVTLAQKQAIRSPTPSAFPGPSPRNLKPKSRTPEPETLALV